MAANGPGRRAWWVKEHGVERLRRPSLDIGGNDFGRQAEPRQIIAEPFEPYRRAIDCRYAGAGKRKLGRLTARRSAEVGDPAAADVTEKPCRQRCCRILDPPCALGKTRQRT